MGIPSSWALPSGLEVLDMTSSGLYGTIPLGWDLPATLHELDLANNYLTGKNVDWSGLEHHSSWHEMLYSVPCRQITWGLELAVAGKC